MPPNHATLDQRLRIAVISTVWFPYSHTDVIVSRWIQPYSTDAAEGWNSPKSYITSVFIEQKPDNDIGQQICRENGISVCGSVKEALTLGGSSLSVDAVLLIAEHGEYPINDLGQKLYPRKRLFDEIVSVFRESGRGVPVFNDKHFSWDFTEASEMIATADELGFPLYGGSSLPHCNFVPALPPGPIDSPTSTLSLFHGDPDHYGFHSIELAQSVVEKRPRGEVGICAVRGWKGAAVLDAIRTHEICPDLMVHALMAHGYPGDDETIAFLLQRTQNPIAFQILHVDGLSVTHLLLPTVVTEWVLALRSPDAPISKMKLSLHGATHFFDNFAKLNAQIEHFFQTGSPPNPPLRTLLSTGALQSLLHACEGNGTWQETPHLHISYPSET